MWALGSGCPQLPCSPNVAACPFLISGTVICGVCRTRRPVCVLQLSAGIKRRRLQMYATLGSVSRAAETICSAWQGPQIYGVYVPLHLWARDEKVPLFFCPPPSLPQLYPSTSVSSLFLDPSCMTFRWTRIGSHREGIGTFVWFYWVVSAAGRCRDQSEWFSWHVIWKQPGYRRPPWRSVLA